MSLAHADVKQSVFTCTIILVMEQASLDQACQQYCTLGRIID